MKQAKHCHKCGKQLITKATPIAQFSMMTGEQQYLVRMYCPDLSNDSDDDDHFEYSYYAYGERER